MLAQRVLWLYCLTSMLYALCRIPTPILQWESLETVLIITVGEPYITVLVLDVENEVNSSTIPPVLEF